MRSSKLASPVKNLHLSNKYCPISKIPYDFASKPVSLILNPRLRQIMTKTQIVAKPRIVAKNSGQIPNNGEISNSSKSSDKGDILNSG